MTNTKEMRVPAPAADGGYGWVVVAVSLLCHAICDGTIYSFGVLLPKLVDYFDEGKGTVAWIGSLLAGINLSSGLLGSVLVNKFESRTTCIFGSVVATVAVALSSLSNSLVMLMMTYGVAGGIGLGLVYFPTFIIVGQYFQRKRALAIGITVCGTGLGSFTMAPLITFLLDRYDWRGTTLILSGIIFHCSILGLFMKPLSTKPSEQDKTVEMAFPDQNGLGELGDDVPIPPNSESSDSPAQQPTSGESSLINFKLIRNPIFGLFTIAFALADLGFYVPYIYIVDLAVNKNASYRGRASFLISAIGIGNMIGRVISGLMADFRWVDALTVMYICTAVSGVVVICIPFCHIYIEFIAAASLFGLFSASFNALSSIVLTEIFGASKLADAFGLFLLVDGVAVILGPPLAGWLFDTTHSYEGPFALAGALILTSSILFSIASCSWRYRKRHQQKTYSTKFAGETPRLEIE